MKTTAVNLCAISLASIGLASLAALGGCRGHAPAKGEAASQGDLPPAETTRVKLCDNQTTVDVPADAPAGRPTGQKIADALMSKWRVKNPGADWEAEERKSRTFVPAADNGGLVQADSQAAGDPYRQFSPRELFEWRRETERQVVAGSRVFHDAKELGSTVSVSCDMCHPNAANTHPETYPKFQTQLGRVALLRDMINWCLEHPVRAQPMAADDPRMRAMEAYIISQRSGTPLQYGKH